VQVGTADPDQAGGGIFAVGRGAHAPTLRVAVRARA
jgi:hypothetical protein